MVSGALISCVLWALFRSYPIYSETYIERSSNVDTYLYTSKKEKSTYALEVTAGNIVYEVPAFAKLDLEAPEDFTDKDYYFDTKVNVLNHKCHIGDDQKKYCTNAMFYDGYFYSYKYDGVFRIYKTTEERKFLILIVWAAYYVNSDFL